MIRAVAAMVVLAVITTAFTLAVLWWVGEPGYCDRWFFTCDRIIHQPI